MGIRKLLGWRHRRRALEDELDEELEYHLSRVAQRLEQSGWTEEAARREALGRFGPVQRHRRAMRWIDRKGMWMMEMRNGVGRGWSLLGRSFRSLARSPRFTFNVAAILGLGIGANAVMFGVVDRLLLRAPQHVAQADGVKRIYLQRSFSNGTSSLGQTLTFPDYLDLQGVEGFQSVAAWTDWGDLVMGRGDEAQEVRVKLATASFFQLLGVSPRLGRFYGEGEDGVESPPLAVLSWEFWERRFGGNANVIGQVLDIGSGRHEVVGIAPPGFTGADLAPVDLWIPLETSQAIRSGNTSWRDSRNNWWLRVVARLSPGASETSAGAEATAAHRGARQELIDADRYSADATLIPASLIAAKGPSPTRESRVATWLAGVSLIVLLIACFNTANLLLARATANQQTTAVRLALGAGRTSLVAERILESLLLATLGAGAGLLLATLFGGPIHEALLPGVSFNDTGVGGRLALFAGIAAALSGLVSGVLPALQSTGVRFTDALKGGGRGEAPGGSRVRSALLIAQAALSVVLLICAGLFVRSLANARGLDLGIEADEVAVLELVWNGTYEATDRAQVYEAVLSRLLSSPQVRTAGLTYTQPFRSSLSIGRPRVPGLDSIPRHSSGGPYANKVSSGYFAALGLDIVRGRPFQASDDAPGAEPVAVISEGMARAIWPDDDPVGQCMMLGSPDDDPPCTQVVGVVENHRRESLVEDDPHFLYFLNQDHPAFQGPPQAVMARLVTEASLPALAADLRRISPLIRYVVGRPLQQDIDPQLRSWRLGATMFAAFGLLALAVAAWGLFSVLAFDVARRRREIGVRAALGADTARILRLVLRRALSISALGIGLGMGIAWIGGRFLEPLLFRIDATDPLVYAAVASALFVSAFLAALVPAFRASAVQPTEALRME